MKKTIRNLARLFVMLICIMGIGTTAFATEVQTNSETNLKDCRVTYKVVDTTNSVFVDDITVTLISIDNPDLIYTKNITSMEYFFNITVGDNVKYGNYNIALSYPSKDAYTIQNSDGTAISSFVANSETFTFNWTIQSKDKPADTTSTPVGGVDGSTKAFISDTDNEEADTLWNDFLSKVTGIGQDDKTVNILKMMNNLEAANAKNYEKITGESQDVFKNKTDFEQFLWYASYILPVNATTAKDNENYCGTFIKWTSNSVNMPIYLLDSYGTTEMKASFLSLTEWQYNEYRNGKGVYNFFTGGASIDKKEIKEATVTPDGKTNDGDPTKEEIERLFDKENKKDDIWSGTKDLVKGNWVTILILLVLVGATIGVVIYRKRKAIEL